MATSRRWWVLAILALTQLVIVLDATIVNIALPQAQRDLGLSDAQRQWVITAYALVFGALLLMGGRVADYWGRKRAFLVGIAGFGLASALGGMAQNGGQLIAARAAQGLFAAILAPAALGLLTVTFAAGKDRTKAFAVFSAIAGSGAAAGLLLGGVLTEFADWRWCLFVNIGFSVVGLAGGGLVLHESRAEGDKRLDVAGAITATAGLGALVYGFTVAEGGWAKQQTIGFLALGVALLAAFVWIESRVAQPLLPLRIVMHGVRGGAFIVQAIVGTVFLGSTLYLTLYFQIVLGMTPLAAGVANVALTVTILVVFPILTKVVLSVGPRTMMIIGPLLSAGGLLYLSRIRPDGDYFLDVLPGMVVLGIGLALILVPLQNLALTGVHPHDAGAAAATVNSAQQVGGSIGLAAFTVVYGNAVAEAPRSQTWQATLTEGYAHTFIAAAIGMLFAALVAVLLIRGNRADLLPDASGGSPIAPH